MTPEDETKVRQIVGEAMAAHLSEFHQPVAHPPTFIDATSAVLSNVVNMGVFADADGFTGRGYVGMWGCANETVTFEVEAPSDGVYTIVVRYQNAGSADAIRFVQGRQVAFPITMPFGVWSMGTWTDLPITSVALKKGTNLFVLANPHDQEPFTNFLDLNGIVSITRTGDTPLPPPPVTNAAVVELTAPVVAEAIVPIQVYVRATNGTVLPFAYKLVVDGVSGPESMSSQLFFDAVQASAGEHSIVAMANTTIGWLSSEPVSITVIKPTEPDQLSFDLSPPSPPGWASS